MAKVVVLPSRITAEQPRTRSTVDAAMAALASRFRWMPSRKANSKPVDP
jgi:hypothetical protein